MSKCFYRKVFDFDPLIDIKNTLGRKTFNRSPAINRSKLFWGKIVAVSERRN